LPKAMVLIPQMIATPRYGQARKADRKKPA
jgi:hypothetical protein